MHLEYDYRTDIDKVIIEAKKYLNVDKYYYKRLERFSFNINDIIEFIFFIFHYFSGSINFSKKYYLIRFFYIFYIYINFISYKKSLITYKNAKIALVGYDILFPIELSFALEGLGIKTVSTNERMLPSFLNNHSYIIHTQFMVSDYFTKIIDSNPNYFIKKSISIGDVRSDYFFTKND